LTRGKIGLSESETESKLKNAWRSRKLSATSDLQSAIAQSDAIIVTTNPKIDDKRNIDYSEVDKFFKQIGTNLKQGTVVIYTGIASLGFMENVAKEALVNASGLKVGEGIGLAYSPMKVPKDNPCTDFVSNLELGVAASDRSSLDSASAVMGTITKRNVKQVTNLKMAELAWLFSAARREANLALTNELAILCENASIDYLEILKLLDSQFAPSTLAPAIGVDSPIEADMLLENAEDLNTKLRLVRLSRQLNEDMVKHAVNLTQSALRSCGRTLRRSKISLFGTTAPGTPGETYTKIMEAKGARTNSLDPIVKTSEDPSRSEKPRRNFTDVAEGADCIVFLEGQDKPRSLNFKNLKTVMRSPSAIIDLSGALDPEKIETEGFIYRGLGRGSRKK
jgi:nucleotide sugar dehydrogenase